MTLQKDNTKKILKAVGAFFLTWLGEKLLDSMGLFDKLKLGIDKYPKNNFFYFFNKTYSLWEIIIVLILLFLSYRLMALFVRQNKVSKMQKLQNDFKKQFEFMTIPDFVLKTKVTFDTENNLILQQIIPYCHKHGEPPIKMVKEYRKYSCPHSTCNQAIDNTNLNNAFERLEHLVETDLEEQWRIFRSKS